MGKFTFGQTGVSYECAKVVFTTNDRSPRCPRCHQTVYFNEEKKAIEKSWHARCFTCCECKKTLSGTNYNEFDGDIMCTTCHRRHSTATINYPAAATASTNSATVTAADDEDGDDSTSQSHSHTAESPRTPVLRRPIQTIIKQDAECCPQCGLAVYFAEEIKALRRKWHRLCFKCLSCKRTLEPGKCTEHQGQLFCYHCYHKRFGPRSLTNTPSCASDVDRCDEDGALAYTDTFEGGNGHIDEPTQPIRGAQEWTESILCEQTSGDYQQYRLL